MKARKTILIGIALITALLAGAPAASAAVWPPEVPRVAIPTQRVAGPTRFSTAVAIAAKTYPGWTGVSHVIVASGDDRATADALTAASLCWAYDAPILLTTRGATPADTRAALAAIVSVNTTVSVTVVGGSGSIPSGRIAELKAIVGPKGSVEQPWPSGDRYALARGIAARTAKVAADTSRVVPSAVFIAGGERLDTFWDALAASAISRHTGIPILLTATKTVPYSTQYALASMPGAQRIVVGGPATVTPVIWTALGATARWSGADRYGTASAIATNAAAAGWADQTKVAVAVAMPDAVTGAGLIGREGGVLVLSGRDRISRRTWQLLSDPTTPPVSGYLFGGTGSATPYLLNELNGYPALPAFGSTTPAAWAGASTRVAGSVGGNTTSLTLVVDGVTRNTTTIAPWGTFDFGTVLVPTAGAKISVVASNPASLTTTLTRSVKRLIYPYPTCIVIDKSDFKLYWVKNNVLVKVYPIATGRASMETPVATWKILAKYKTDPAGVYGPRKMRLFRRVGNQYVYTAYGIHGTNEPWVIGTKASHGCIRMYNSDILQLWPQVPLGTMVITRE